MRLPGPDCHAPRASRRAASMLRAAAAGMLLLGAVPLAADVVVLNDGQKVEGEITDRGDSVVIKTRLGALTVRKEEIRSVVPAPGRAVAAAEQLLATAKALEGEALAAGVTPDARDGKLEAALSLLNRALKDGRAAREVYAGDEGRDLDRILASLDAGARRCREALTAKVPSDVKPAASLEPPPVPVRVAPVRPPPSPAAPPARPPVPSAEDLKKAEALLADLYRDAPRRTPADLLDLARAMLKTGLETRDDLAARYLLFRDSRDAAAKAGSPDDAFRAVDAMEKAFDVDACDLRASAVEALARTARTPAAALDLVEECLRLVDALVTRDDYDRAVKVLATASSSAATAGDAAAAAGARARDREVRALQAEFRKAEAGIRKLAESPEDPEACLAAGRFRCFVKGDWEAGLPLLAKGGDAALKALAAQELAPGADVARLALADGWYQAFQGQSGLARERVAMRALTHYRAAVDGLSGAEAERARKRMAELEKAAGLAGSAAVPSGAVLHLSFDKSTIVAKGGKRFVRDLSGSGLDAELSGGRTEPGVAGDCLQLDGGHAVVPAGKALDLGGRTGAFTIACWVRFDKAFGSEAMLFEHDVFGQAASWQLTFMDCHTPRVNFPALHAKEKPVDGVCNFKPGEWHHIAGTYDGKLGQLFADGQRITEQKVALPLPAGEAPSYIGSRGGRGLLMPGSLDELLVYPRVLKDAEIRALAAAGRRGATAR